MKNIEQYLNKEMGEVELDNFTEKLIQYRFDKKQKAIWAAKMEKELQITRSDASVVAKKRISWKSIAAMAASILLAVTTTIFYQSNFSQRPPQRMAMNMLEKEDGIFSGGNTRKGANDISVSRGAFYNACHDKAYLKAIELGKKLEENGNLESIDYFAIGQLYLFTKKPNEAILNLEKFLELNKKNYPDETRWFLSLAYILNNQESDAKKELKYIINNEGWKTEEATKLLESLEFLK